MSETRKCVGVQEALDFFSLFLPDMLPEDIKDEEFCSEYQVALNRVRYELEKSLPIKPKRGNGRLTTYNCGNCGHCIRTTEMYCPQCGRAINWSGRNNDG